MKTICSMTANNLCTVKVCEIEKTDAKEFLQHNSRNRNINKSNVDILMRSMNDGKWMFNGDTIVVDSDGFLKSGQHRLTAFCMSNIESMTCVIVYLKRNDDVLLTLNRGKSMSCSQYLRIVGIENASSVSSLSRSVYFIMNDIHFNERVLDYEIESLVRRNPCIHEFVRAARGRASEGEKNIPLPIVAPICAVSIMVPSVKDEMLAEVRSAKMLMPSPGCLSSTIVREAMRLERVSGSLYYERGAKTILSQMYRYFKSQNVTRNNCSERSLKEVVKCAIEYSSNLKIV